MSTTSRPWRFLLLSLLLVSHFGLTACSDAEGPGESRQAGTSASTEASPDSTDASVTNAAHAEAHASNKSSRKPEPSKAPRNANERPLPNFEGMTLAGTRLKVSELLGSRLLIFIVNPEVESANPVAEAVGRIAKLRGDHNFDVLGVGVGSNASTLSRFATEHKLDFSIIDDSDGSITQILRLRSPVAILGIDAEGYLSFGIGSFPAAGEVASIVEAQLREQLRLPAEGESASGQLLSFPKAPALGVTAMSNGEVVETEELAGQAAVVIFFLHTCPHCHKALESIKTTLAGIDEANRPRLVAVSIQNQPSSVRRALKDLGLDYFDPYLDPGQAATDRWGVTGGVPAIFVLDKESRIRYRSTGWEEKRHAGMLRMNLARAAGIQVPMLLDPKGYSGNQVCAVCHEQEFAAWEYTKHATAFDTLVTHTADRRTDCVGCHVVGFEESGGYDFTHRPTHLEGVGCESCHGRGGPHLSPAFVPASGYAEVCSTCHNPTHSLGFDYETFHPRISHKAVAALSNEDRLALLGGTGPSRDLLQTRADYVGSDACQSCHQAEFKTWETSPHGQAIASLEKKDKAADPECLACHTTAFGKTGGFPTDSVVAHQPDLARVGCESCHGPGSEHVGKTAKRVGTILSLGDKCDSCVILKVCGDCHDDANDPGFQFEVEKRIDAQRHGTIESAATREGTSASLDHRHHESPASPHPPSPSQIEQHDRKLLNDAFDHLARISDTAPSAVIATDPS